MGENEIATIVATWGGGAGALVAFVFAFMKMWKTFHTDKLSTVRDGTESTLIKSMMGDIDRFRHELKEVRELHKSDLESLREAHRRDREDFLLEIAGLKRELGIVKRKNESMRAEALEAYAYVSNSKIFRENVECITEIKDRLMRIAVEDVPSVEA